MQSTTGNLRQVGTVQRVLVDGPNRKGGRLAGRTENERRVIFDGDLSLVGQFVDVNITRAGETYLDGKLARTKPI